MSAKLTINDKHIAAINLEQLPPRLLWFEGDALKTYLLNAISISLPETERFIVKVFKRYQKEHPETPINQQLNHFIKEEIAHSLHHTRFNRALTKQGYPVSFLEKLIKFTFNTHLRLNNTKNLIAISVCLEYLATVLCQHTVANNLIKPKHSPLHTFFYWHAKEELNHRAVAYTLYQQAGGGYLRLRLWMLYVAPLMLINLMFCQGVVAFSNVVKHKKAYLKNMFKGLPYYFGKRGLAWHCIKYCAAFFLPKIKLLTECS